MSQYKEIGRGTFGVVFCSADCPNIAVKKTFKSRSTLAVEFECGLATSFAVNASTPVLLNKLPDLGIVPRVPWYQASHGMEGSASEDSWWKTNRKLLPSSNGDNVPNGVFLFERIPPVPRSLQEILIRRFWPKERQKEALNNPENQDCLVRPYLQERWAYYESKGRKRLNNEQKDSLRNFPAYLDDLQSMGIDCHSVARQMALGLAVGHWEAQHDMTDVEFVIAGKHRVPQSQSTMRGYVLPLDNYDKLEKLGNRNSTAEGQAKNDNYGLPRDTQMWLVDFDKCNRVQVWEDNLAHEIRKLALGICVNDPYYPGPLPDTKLGWDVFVTFTETYIQASQHLLHHTFAKVPTSDEQLRRVLQRPIMVMRTWTTIVMDAKRNNEKDVYEMRVRIRKKGKWTRPSWSMDKMGC